MYQLYKMPTKITNLLLHDILQLNGVLRCLRINLQGTIIRVNVACLHKVSTGKLIKKAI
jgi:hypothetical protein